MGVEFKPVAAAALELAHVLLPDWLGGKRVGNEWKGERRANGGPGDSWAVNMTTGQWIHGASGDVGGDLVSLYAALHHIDQVAALREVADVVGVNGSTVKRLPMKRPPPEPAAVCDPIPEDAPEVPDHPRHGPASAVYRYGTAFYVCRYDLPDGTKQFAPATWRGGKWVMRGYTKEKPLYGVEFLAQKPEAPVLVVEGEKCADAARAVLRAYVILTWAGGAGAVTQSDWTPLKGRDVLIWPDADQPGAEAATKVAAKLAGIAKRVRVLTVADQPEGWDVSDAIKDRWGAKEIAEWARDRVKTVFPSEPPPEPAEDAPPPDEAPAELPAPLEAAHVEAGESAVVHWQNFGLDCNQGGEPFATVANVSAILRMHPGLQGRIWYDSFRDKILHTLTGPERQWTDADDINLTVRIQQQLHLPKFNTRLVTEGIGHAARLNTVNSLTRWLDTLEWDGTPRLETWLADCLGVERNPYSIAVSKNWPIAMIARAYVPGCQVDTMPVLEGKMGRGKSRFLELLAAPWFKSLPMAFGDKEFLQNLMGAWLVEIPDMTGFSKREHSQILATITIRSDEYRKSYGRRSESHPRVAVFAATSETDDYLQDTRGRRRYWPLRCMDIDLDALNCQRDQVFAEAILQYRAGASWHHMPAETDDEQMQRAVPDLWTDKVMGYADELLLEQNRTGHPLVTTPRILSDALEMPISKQTDVEKKRIARIMRDNGWIPTRTQDSRYWTKPQR